MKKNIGKVNASFPTPVVVVGAMVDGKPNWFEVAWTGIGDAGVVTLSVTPTHKTCDGIRAEKKLSVNFLDEALVPRADFVGIVSGNKTPDKVKKSGLTVTKSEFVDAPVVNELPLVLECELVSMNEENCNVVGKIVNCAVEEAALTDGKPDAAKMKPLCFDTCQHVYRIMGEVVASAFSVGKELA